jgi:uncharacterized protein with GYD domain
MATYILLMTLTPEGQKEALHDPEYLINVEQAIHVPGVQAMGIYGVLGAYDFVTIVEAEDNDRMARFSLELGVGAKVHITTMPAVPISRLDPGDWPASFQASVSLDDLTDETPSVSQGPQTQRTSRLGDN